MHLSTNRKRIYLYLLIFFSLTTAININYDEKFNKIFKLKNINIVGIGVEEQKKLQEELSIFKNKNIFLIKTSQVVKILDNYNEFENFKIQKILPSKLKLEIKKTEFSAKTIINGRKYYIGENKKFIETKDFDENSELPIVFGKFPIESFFKLQKNLIDNFKSDRWDLITKNNITIKLPINDQLMSLKHYKFLINGNKVKINSILDFRIPNQIIITSDK